MAIIKIKGHSVAHLHQEILGAHMQEIFPEREIKRWSSIEFDNLNEVWTLTILSTGEQLHFNTREAALTHEHWLYGQTNMEGKRCDQTS